MKAGEVFLCDDPSKYIPAPDRTAIEIDRIRDCVTAFEALPDDEARQRVLRYLVSRYVGGRTFI